MSQNMVEILKRKLTAKNITAMILFGAIIMVFVFFGFPNQYGAGVGAAAVVNSKLISVADLNQETERISQYYSQFLGGAMDISSQRQMLLRQALESLIQNELVAQAAYREGILATDAEIRNFIVQDIPVFKENGVFQRDLYELYLQNSRSSAGEFENKIRKDIQGLRARRVFEMAARPAHLELEKMNQLKLVQVNVEYVRMDQAAIEKSMDKGKFEEFINKIEELLKENNESELRNIVKKMNLKWDETGWIDLATGPYAKFNSKVASEAIFEIPKTNSVLNRLVRDGNFKFILKLKAVRNQKVEEKKLNLADDKLIDSLQRRRGSSLFNSWVAQARESSNIKTNLEIFRN